MNENKIVDFNAYRESRRKPADKEVEVEKPKGHSRVKPSDFTLMMFAAVCFDGVQALLLLVPVVGWILASGIGICAWMTFELWSFIKGWRLSSQSKKLMVRYVLPMVEVVPVVNTLPTWSLRVFLQLSYIKAEDALSSASGGKLDVEKATNLYKKAA